MAHPDARNVQMDIDGQKLIEAMWHQMERGGSDTNPYRQMFKRWGSIYQAAMLRRFIAKSRGGWQPLARGTARSRRAGRAGKSGESRGRSLMRLKRERRTLEGKSRARVKAGRGMKGKMFGGSFTRQVKLDSMIDHLSGGEGVSILVDTGQLRDALKPGRPGELRDDIPWGVDVGFSNSMHTALGGALHMSPTTMGDIAAFHHFGAGNNPERPILVPPDGDARQRMNEAMGLAQRRIATRLNALYKGMTGA